MPSDELPVEPVGSVDPVPDGERSVSRYAPSTIYQIELAMLALRCERLEHRLETERRQRERVVDQYEELLAQRNEEMVDDESCDDNDVKRRIASVFP